MRNWFPPDQADKIAKRFLDWVKDNPPDPSIDKNLGIGVTEDENGMILAISLSEIMKGKEKEVLELASKQNLFMAAGIVGFKYKSEIIHNFPDAYKILGMTAPEV